MWSRISVFFLYNLLVKCQFDTYRLPNNTIPVKYDLWIRTEIDKEIFEFSGQVRINVKVLETTKNVVLHFRQINVTKVNLVDQKTLNFSFDIDKEFLIIDLPTAFTPGKIFILEISYNGILRDDLLGFHRISYIDSSNKTIWLAATNFEPINARHAFPCYDEPQIRVPISMAIEHDESYHAISNMPVISQTRLTQNQVITKFADTPPMQSYLLAFVISNLKYVESNDGRVQQRIYARPEAIDAGECEFMVTKVDDILRKFEDYYGIPYILPKLDHVALPSYKPSKIKFNLIKKNEILLNYY